MILRLPDASVCRSAAACSPSSTRCEEPDYAEPNWRNVHSTSCKCASTMASIQNHSA
jgi:hypothetical protein